MIKFKNSKYLALILFSLCMSLDVFGSTAFLASQTSLGAEGDVPGSRVRTGSITLNLEDIKETLGRKSQILRDVLPEAKKSLDSIERGLLIKIESIKETNFRRATELAGLVSSVKCLDGSLHNIFSLSTRDSKDVESLAMIGIAISASGALKENFRQLTEFLDASEDTRDIDCSILKKAVQDIHEITKDIYNPVI